MAKSMLIISRQAPWCGPLARETLDLALAGGAFDLPVAMLFMDEGVLQLLDQQQPKLIQIKDLQANIKALPMFGVEQLFACQESLTLRGVNAEHLLPGVSVLSAEALRDLMQHYDHVVTL